MERKTSTRGLAFNKRFEGFEALPYRDIAGIWTIGHGHASRALHLLMEGEDLARDDAWLLNYVEIGDDAPIHITPAKAEALMARDLVPVDTAINSMFQGLQMQFEHDACASFLFNVGVAAFDPKHNPNTAGRAMLALHGMAQPQAQSHSVRASLTRPLADAFLWWDKATVNGVTQVVRGLTRRRIEEAELFLYGDYELLDDGVVTCPGVTCSDDAECVDPG